VAAAVVLGVLVSLHAARLHPLCVYESSLTDADEGRRPAAQREVLSIAWAAWGRVC
jgi:hypothetical protein